MNNNILIDLSKIFKKGYTIQIHNDSIKQYSKINKPYIVSYKTLITIHNDMPVFSKYCKIPKHCIIRYWFNKKDNIGHIELNKVFNDKDKALIFAINHSQKCIYDMNSQKTINEYKGIKL